MTPFDHDFLAPANTAVALGMVGFMLLLAGQLAWLAAAAQTLKETRDRAEIP